MQRTVVYYTVSEKVPTFKLSVSLSNLNQFSKFLHCWKAYEICYKTIQHHPSHLRYVATLTLPWEIRNSNFLQIFSMEENANKLHFECTDLHSSTRVTVCAECICVLTEYLKYLSIRRHRYFRHSGP